MSQCRAVTKNGRRCKNRAGAGSQYCLRHQQNVVGSLCTLAALVVGNLVPAVGVVCFGWNVATILILYWLENLTVGLLTFCRMRLALGGRRKSTRHKKGEIRPDRFFLIHYSGFTAAHGVFVLLVCGSIIQPESAEEVFHQMAALWVGLLVGSLGLFAEHAASFYFDYYQNESFKRAKVDDEMFKPYPRLMAMHFSLLVGVVILGGGQGVVLLLVVLHLAIDMVTWANQLQWEGPLARIGNATVGGVMVGGFACFLAFMLGGGLLSLVGWGAMLLGYGDDLLDRTLRWAFCAAAVLGCFAGTTFALGALLDAFDEQTVRKKRVVWAVSGAIAITALIVWGASKVLPML